MITHLEPHQVFVFGSNNQGFHGSGAAAMAFRYEPNKPWSRETFFTTAMNSPKGSPNRVGKWTVFGVGRGYCEGKEGATYAIATVDFSPQGKRTKVPLDDIAIQMKEFVEFAHNNPDLEFLVTKFGTGLAGYYPEQIQNIWDSIPNLPNNLTFV